MSRTQRPKARGLALINRLAQISWRRGGYGAGTLFVSSAMEAWKGGPHILKRRLRYPRVLILHDLRDGRWMSIWMPQVFYQKLEFTGLARGSSNLLSYDESCLTRLSLPAAQDADQAQYSSLLLEIHPIHNPPPPRRIAVFKWLSSQKKCVMLSSLSIWLEYT